MKTVLLMFLFWGSLNAEALDYDKKMKCWCHSLAAVYGDVTRCEEYKCPCEGANGACPGSKNSNITRPFKEVPANGPKFKVPSLEIQEAPINSPKQRQYNQNNLYE